MISPITEFIESGILELYVMGAASPEEILEVERMATLYPEISQEIEQISVAIEHYAQTHAVKPRETVKTLLLATIDYLERMKQGELPESPPVVTANSRISDYEAWLNHKDAGLPENAANIYARIIGYTPTATTAIIWIKEKSEQEIHHDEYERFLIVEGTCQMVAGDQTYMLGPGDYFVIPLHTTHQLTVTSDMPCKAILQRLSVA